MCSRKENRIEMFLLILGYSFLTPPPLRLSLMYTDRQLDKRRIRVLVGMEQDEDTGFQDGVWVALITSQPCGCEKLSAPLAPPWEAGGLVKLRK